MACTCTLCLLSEKQSSDRRRLYSTPSRLVLKELKALATRFGHSAVVPADPGSTAPGPATVQPYLCRKCYAQVERVSKLRADLFKLENDVAKKLHRAAVNLGVQPSTSAEAQAEGEAHGKAQIYRHIYLPQNLGHLNIGYEARICDRV